MKIVKTQKKDFFIDSLKKGQKCFGCKKIIKNDWCWNGYFWHSKCKDLDTSIRIKKYLKGIKNKIKNK